MTKLLTYIFLFLFTFTSSVNACYFIEAKTGFGFSTSVGFSTDEGKTTLHPNGETSLTLKDTGSDKEQITHATIGEGVIEVAQGSDLTGLNRDTTKAQEITKDMTTGALDASASIDNRVFTSEGRADIVEQHEKLGENLSQIGNGLRNNIITKTIENTIKGDKSLSENFYDYVEQDRQMTELKENRKDLMLALNGMTNFDSEEAKNILQQIADLTAGENGFSGKLQLANVEGNIAGFSYQSNDGEIKNITINLANVDLTKPNELMDVIYHETTNFEEHKRKEKNAINRGETGAGIFSLKNFGNENTNGMSKTEWMKENNLTIGSTGSLSLLNDVNNDKLGNGEGNPQVATATGCSLGPIGCVAGAGIDWIVAGTVATSVATAGLMLYNSSNDNSSGQEPENMNNNDNNGGDKDPNSWCAKYPKLCNYGEKIVEISIASSNKLKDGYQQVSNYVDGAIKAVKQAGHHLELNKIGDKFTATKDFINIVKEKGGQIIHDNVAKLSDGTYINLHKSSDYLTKTGKTVWTLEIKGNNIHEKIRYLEEILK